MSVRLLPIWLAEDGYKIVYLCVTHDSWLTQSMFENMIPDTDQVLTILQQVAWKGPKPSFACLKTSASVVKSHHQIASIKTSKFWRNHDTSRWSMPYLNKRHHFHHHLGRSFQRNFLGSYVAWMLCRSCQRMIHICQIHIARHSHRGMFFSKALALSRYCSCNDCNGLWGRHWITVGLFTLFFLQ